MTLTRPPVNEVLLDKTLEQIKLFPKDWDQSVWRCSSGMCFAGTAADLDGAQWACDANDEVYAEYVVVSPDTMREMVGAGVQTYHFLPVTQDIVNSMEKPTCISGDTMIGVEHYASWRLGIDADGTGLFEGDNTLTCIEEIVRDIKTSAGLL